MSSIASLGRMVSGLTSSQVGLQVTGQNLSNLNTKGYTRQQLLQHDSNYLNLGSSGKLQQVGLGVSMSEIRQVRDEFADKRYRTENSVLSFYQTKQSAVSEIEAILDEPHGESLSGIMKDFWQQTQKLSTNPSGVEERLAFIQTADVLAKRMNQIMNGYTDYQYHLNDQVKDSVKTINQLTQGIKDMNEVIAAAEINGDNANDYRDQRNLMLDELSTYIDIEYYENTDGRLTVTGAGRTLVDQQFVTQIDVKHVDNDSGFVVPVWKDTGKPMYNLNSEINSSNGNDSGKLKSLLMVRGEVKADANTSWAEIAINNNKSVDANGNAYMLPKLQKEFAMFTQTMVDVVNEALNGFGIDGEEGIPVFVPIKKPEGAKDEDYLYAGNIQVNPLLLAEGGYNKLGTVKLSEDGSSANVGDNSLVLGLLDEWSKARPWPDGADGSSVNAPKPKETNFMDFYAEYVSDLGAEGFEYNGKVKEKMSIVSSTENERLAIGGVSQDEELSNMLKYQYAYNAAARMVNMLDGMMDTLINRM